VKIIVCVKQVPDTAAEMTVQDGSISWGDASLIINPWDEFAVEAALDLKAEEGGEVIALGLGREDETEAIKHALAMGADDAVLIADPALEQVDTLGAARVIAAALDRIGEVDLVLFGQQSVDSETGLLPGQVGRLWGHPTVTLVSTFREVDAEAGSVQVERAMEEADQVVQTPLPCVISVTKDYGEPRYPSFMGIRKASQAKYPIWDLAELDVDLGDVLVQRLEVSEPPEREVVTEIIAGETPEEKARVLVEKMLEEKVL